MLIASRHSQKASRKAGDPGQFLILVILGFDNHLHYESSGKPFLSTAHALIDVYEGDHLKTRDTIFDLKGGDTPTISYDNFESVKRIDLIDATCAEYAPKVLDFTESGDSTSIILDPPSFTPFEGSEMILEEEIDEFLKHDESLNMDLNDEFNDEDGDCNLLRKIA
ncbi:hypothetical protein Tco_0268941 [Tanacetum coccineum]